MKASGTVAGVATAAAAALYSLHGPALCAVCGDHQVYGNVRAFCAWCFRQLTPDLQAAVREVGDLPRDDPRKQAVIERCRRKPRL